MTRKLTRQDIWPMDRYAGERRRLRQETVARKRARLCEVGPVATFSFESYETMWAQVHEMLYVEKGGEEQIQEELDAYNPLIPEGDELVATVMFEIDDPVRRAALLARLGGVEETAFIEVGGHRVAGVPEADLDRTTADGKASAVQFIHFPFTAEQRKAFAEPGTRIILGFSHDAYSHMAILAEETRAALAADFDQ